MVGYIRITVPCAKKNNAFTACHNNNYLVILYLQNYMYMKCLVIGRDQIFCPTIYVNTFTVNSHKPMSTPPFCMHVKMWSFATSSEIQRGDMPSQMTSKKVIRLGAVLKKHFWCYYVCLKNTFFWKFFGEFLIQNINQLSY